MKRLIAVLMLILVGGCIPLGSGSEAPQAIVWTKVTEPPGYTGVCYGYFMNNGATQTNHSYSGVVCWEPKE